MKQFLLLFSFIWIFLCSRCSTAAERPIVDHNKDVTPVTLQFYVSTPNSKGYAVNPELVSNINVYIFYSDNGLLADYVYLNGETSCVVRLPLSGNFTYYAIANTGRLGIKNNSQVISYCHILNQASGVATEEGGILLCGKKEAAVTHGGVISIALQRCVARVQLSVDTSAMDANTHLSFTRVALRNVAAQVSCFSPSAVTTQSQVFDVGESKTGAELESLYHSGVLFHAYENCQGTLLPLNTQPSLKTPPVGMKNLCTYVELEADYESPSQRGTVLYRFYVGSDHLTNFDFVRNTNYRIHVTFSGSGINEVSWRVSAETLNDRPLQVSITPATFVFEDFGLQTTLRAFFSPSTVFPAYTGIDWQSSNPAVATVSSSGVVTALAAGECQITATSTDSPSVVGTATITVNQPVYALNITSADNVLYYHKDTVQRGTGTVELSPASSGYAPLWESSDWGVATVFQAGSSTAIIPTGSGEATLTAIHPKDPSIRESVSVRVYKPVINLTGDTVLSIRQNSSTTLSATLVNGYPNDKISYISTMPYFADVNSTGTISSKYTGITSIILSAKYAESKRVTVSIKYNLFNDPNYYYITNMQVGEKDTLYTFYKSESIPNIYYFQPENQSFFLGGVGSDYFGMSLGYDYSVIYQFLTVTATDPSNHLLKYDVTRHDESVGTLYRSINISPIAYYCNITNPQVSLSVGSTQLLNYSTNNSSWTNRNNIDWYSSNPQIATVSASGRVTAVKEGSTAVNMYVRDELIRVFQITVTP